MNATHIFSLPLLTKELIEQAQHRRTYILRVVYAIALYGAALIQYRNLSMGGAAAGLTSLGSGRYLFEQLAFVQSLMIVILVPPITCGALTVEKEKDTLALLLLTKLSSWTIVFEKFLSRIFAMGTYQLLSLPLFAIVYGLGGVELDTLLLTIGSLMLLTMVVAAVSILCSTWFRTTFAAFVMTYAILLSVGTCLMPGFDFSGIGRNRVYASVGSSTIQTIVTATVTMIAYSILPVAISAACLMFAAVNLVSRAFIPPRNLVLILFQHADRFFNDLNQWTTGGIVLVPDKDALPQTSPIAWRETRKKSLGTFRYQFRILMLLLSPLILTIGSMLTENRTDFANPFRIFPIYFWTISIVCLTIHSTAVISSERIRQTLDVLLVTPFSSRAIVLEKLSGVRRLIKILTVPFAVLVVFQGIWSGYILSGSTLILTANFWLELLATSLATIVYMPVIMWIGFQLGLRLKTQIQSVLGTFIVIGAACAIPELIYYLTSFDKYYLGSGITIQDTNQTAWFHPLLIVNPRWLSPVQMISLEFSGMNAWTGTLLIAGHFLFYSAVWWWLHRNALRSFSRIVHRGEPTDSDSADPKDSTTTPQGDGGIPLAFRRFDKPD